MRAEMTAKGRADRMFATIVNPSTGMIEPRWPSYSEVLDAIAEAEAAARAELLYILRIVHDEAGNGALDGRRHSLTPMLRDKIEAAIRGESKP